MISNNSIDTFLDDSESHSIEATHICIQNTNQTLMHPSFKYTENSIMPLVTPRRQLARKYITKPKVGFGEALTRPQSNIGMHESPLDFKLNVKESARSVCLVEKKLRAFPVKLLQMRGLKSLSLNYNLINIIPNEIANLVELETLDLSHNELRDINKCITFLKELKFLRLNSNRLVNWPDWLCGELSQLRLLHLHDNPNIQKIPSSFSKMKALVQFSFDWFICIQPKLGTILKDKELIEQTRNFCKETKHKSISFSRFYKFFNKQRTKSNANRTQLLHTVCKLGYGYIVAELIKLGMPVNIQDIEGNTALSLAIKNNKVDCAKILLGSELLDVNLGKTNPLLLSIENERYDLTEGIIEHASVDMMVKNEKEDTVIHLLFAKFDSYPLLIQRILQKVFNCFKVDLNASNLDGFSPLHLAVLNRQHRAILFAVEYNKKAGIAGFDFLKPGGEQGIIPLHEITADFDLDTISGVINQDIDVLRRDHLGRTAKHMSRDGTTSKLLIKREKLFIAKRIHNKTQSNIKDDSNMKGDTLRIKEENEPIVKLINLKSNNKNSLHKIKKAKQLKSYTKEMLNDIVGKFNRRIPNTNDSEKVEQESITKRIIPVFSHKSILSKSTDRLRTKDLWDETESKSVFNVKITGGVDNDFYKIVMNKKVKYWMKYKMVFRLFRDRTTSSLEQMKLLVTKLNDSHPLKADIIYLLGVIGDYKGINLVNKSKGNSLLSKELNNIQEQSLYFNNQYETVRSDIKPIRSKKCKSAFNCYSNIGPIKEYKKKKNAIILSLQVKRSYLYFNNAIYP